MMIKENYKNFGFSLSGTVTNFVSLLHGKSGRDREADTGDC
ncbi:hypothetical protein SRABI04_03516 [Chryseobacterium sp. Bi04]|nr:hypothetical protein SRABI04_03516 [Chryseobacterium sp. Bi04]